MTVGMRVTHPVSLSYDNEVVKSLRCWEQAHKININVSEFGSWNW